jgi:hypothetical protein
MSVGAALAPNPKSIKGAGAGAGAGCCTDMLPPVAFAEREINAGSCVVLLMADVLDACEREARLSA